MFNVVGFSHIFIFVIFLVKFDFYLSKFVFVGFLFSFCGALSFFMSIIVVVVWFIARSL